MFDLAQARRMGPPRNTQLLDKPTNQKSSIQRPYLAAVFEMGEYSKAEALS
jgi:hypothetical protein